MRQSHGIADAKRMSDAIGRLSEQSVSVTDGDNCVILTKRSEDPAGMTPEQACFIADLLQASAARVCALNHEAEYAVAALQAQAGEVAEVAIEAAITRRGSP